MFGLQFLFILDLFDFQEHDGNDGQNYFLNLWSPSYLETVFHKFNISRDSFNPASCLLP